MIYEDTPHITTYAKKHLFISGRRSEEVAHLLGVSHFRMSSQQPDGTGLYDKAMDGYDTTAVSSETPLEHHSDFTLHICGHASLV